MAPVNRPNRIGVEGVTKQWSLREVKAVTTAAQAQAREDGTNLSEILRREMRSYLEYRGWNVDRLIDGDRKTVDAQWEKLLGRKAPKEHKGKPHRTMELF